MTFNKIVIERKLREFLEEDCNFVDVSATHIPLDAITTAKIYVKSDGYVSGLEELKILFDILKISAQFSKKDGDKIKQGEIVIILKGNIRNILLGERLALNLLTHMSSITSTVRKYISIINESGKSVKIACTRKTMPGLRIFEKRAVFIGQGETHRFSLDDMILLKDTHLKLFSGDVAKLLMEVKKTASFSKKIEIEIEKVTDVLIAAENGADIIMFDNMNPNLVMDAIKILKKNQLRNKVIIEVSGGITEENLIDFLIAEPDIISLGLLTQRPTEYIDFSLRFD
ncbi:hypothetical protein LCGC14_1112300 [marine sediment metagenome]|uniref:nicotinate-nucleotide diphosphorylase (carboxylating) n=1 Tax=marine sediment metagenome TaxID=412755 RepID=A0A0F9QCH4_9ZZZZ|nr:MAG: putative nicotinate-nucleotide pyrophosphorylase [carboxylating] [Candidatus Lokiarchaeum sp. GC14_75]